jgi:hypothetical protein
VIVAIIDWWCVVLLFVHSADGASSRDLQPTGDCRGEPTLILTVISFYHWLQGPEGLSQLRKLAQNYPTQETGVAPDLGDIDEDDEVPGMKSHTLVLEIPP